jgi:alpha-tubulin suppressor-like RCC1 family protein
MPRVEIPRALVELLRNPEEIRKVFKFVRAHEHLAFTCDGLRAPLMMSDENAIVSLSEIIPRFALPFQGAGTSGLYLMSNGVDGTESWEPIEIAVVGYELWGWGRNFFGIIGLNNTTEQMSPIQSGVLTTWTKIATGTDCAHGIKSDGTLWACGLNNLGQLGLAIGDTTSRDEFEQVGTDTDWAAVAGGAPLSGNQTAAIKTNGTLWTWGDNTFSQLGLGDTTQRQVPTQVGSDTDWLAVDVGDFHMIALKTNGAMYGWGRNNQRQVGNNTSVTQTTPVQIGGTSDWATIACGGLTSYAIKTDGTLWSWGANSAGGLGLGDNARRAIPTQVGALTTWATISAGNEFAVATKTDGTMWSAGWNFSGQLGIGSLIDQTTFQQIGADTTWVETTCGQTFAAARKSTGEVFAWGDNDLAQLGQGTSTGDTNAPVQVGTDTDWAAISAYQTGIMALKTP